MAEGSKGSKGLAASMYLQGAWAEPGQSQRLTWMQGFNAPAPSARALINAVPTPAVVHRGGVVLAANAAACSLFAFPDSASIEGFNLFAALSSEEMRRFSARRHGEFAECSVGANTPWAHYDLIRRDGGIVSVAFTCAQTRYEGDGAVLSFFIDESRDAALTGALRHSPDVAVVLTDPAGRVTWTNPASQALSGYSTEELIGRRPGEVLQFEGTDQSEVARVRRHLRAGSAVVTELLNRHKRGDEYWVRLQLLPSRSPDGRLLGFVGLQSDVTADVVRRAGQRQAEDRVRNTFSHEVRAPLNTIINLLDLMQDLPHLPEHRRWMDHAVEASHALRDLVNEVLDTSRQVHEAANTAPSPMRVQAVMSQVAVLMAEYPRASRVRLKFDCPQHLPAVLLRADLLRRVLVNLCTNALKYTPAGTVKVAVEHDEASSTAQHLALRISVTDTGIGIAPQDLKRVLNPFETVASAQGQGKESSGLGLALCEQMLKSLGTALRVHSTVGAGSCFSFELACPLVTELGYPGAADPTAAGVTESAPVQRGGLPLDGLNLLLIDDNPVSLLVAEKQLEREGARVHAHGDAQQALNALFAQPPGTFDAVLTDVQMPNLDGIACTRCIKAQPGFENQVVVGVSGEVDTRAVAQARAAGMVDFVEKPFAVDVLVAALLRAISGSLPQE